MEKYAADDRSKWRDTCKGMTPEQIQEEIKRLEAEAADRKVAKDRKVG